MDPNRDEYMSPLEVLSKAMKVPQTIAGFVTIFIGIIVACYCSKLAHTLKNQNLIAILGSIISIFGTQSILQVIAQIQSGIDPANIGKRDDEE
ncbi:MAG: hypothetical protein J5822_04435 [Eubacteriaceae bacterium]|nr:hypothetical protein [Eubacteriaceae bacterium]